MDHRLGFNFGFLMDLEGEYPSNVTPKAPRLTLEQEKLNRALDFVSCQDLTVNPCKEIFLEESSWIPKVFIDRCTIAFEAPKPKSMVGVYQQNPYNSDKLLEMLKGAYRVTLFYNGLEPTPKGKYVWTEHIDSLWNIEYRNNINGIKGFIIEEMH